jgi:hypothetical protein
VTTDVLTAARQRITAIGLADDMTAALRRGDKPTSPRLTDDNAASVWRAVGLRLQGGSNGYDRQAADRGLADLHVRLTSLLDAVRARPDSDDLADLVGGYASLRGAQSTLVAAAVGRRSDVEVAGNLSIPPARLMWFVGTISNIDEVWPAWRDQVRRGTFEHNGLTTPPPWEFPNNQVFEVSATAKNLRWLATGPARPWVPTIGEATRAVGEQMAAEEERRQIQAEMNTYGHSVTAQRRANAAGGVTVLPRSNPWS